MKPDINHFLWTERWRPHTVADCILPQPMLDTFSAFVAKGEIKNMILAGTNGVGKTSVARAMCEEIGCDYIVIKGGEDSGIDKLRTDVRKFASSVSLTSGKPKVVIMDEGDRLNPNTTQVALPTFIEEFSGNCRFIFTVNNKNLLIPAILSRNSIIDFKIEKEDRPKMATRFMGRLKEILKTEGVEYEEAVVAKLLTKYFPDYRHILEELQLYSANGEVDAGILSKVSDVNLKPLIEALKEKDFKKVRAWTANTPDMDPGFFRTLYNEIGEKVTEVPQLILLLNDYSYKSTFVADKELNILACFVEIMATCNFK